MLKIQNLIILLILGSSIFAQNISDLTSEGKLEEIKELLARDKSLVNEKDNEGDIPLCNSIIHRHTQLSLYFIENGAYVNNQNQNGYAPLHWAAIRGDSLVVKALIEKEADINIKTSANQVALHFAASRGHIEVVRLLINNGADMEVNDNYGRTPLLLAARERGGIETVQLLVENGANINAVDIFGDTPLSLVAWRGYEDIVDYLLEENAYFSTTGDEGIKLLKYATDKRLWRLYKSLINKGGDSFLAELKKEPVLHWASAGGSDKIVSDLINLNVQVNAEDSYKWVPLHYAAYFGRLEVIKLLIKKGADVNYKTPLGETPYYLAKLENRNEVVNFLESTGVDQALPTSIEIYGKFLGQNTPGDQPELFAPGIVSRLKGGHSNITFSPDGKMAFWTEWIQTDVGYFPGCVVWYSRMIDNKWTFPKKFLPMGDTPVFSVDGKRIYLMATFPTQQANEKYGIWYYEITEDSIVGPGYLDFDVNGTGLYWQFSFDKDENLYFSSDKGLFRSLKKEGKYSDIENLAEIFHPDYKGGSPYISPDGDYIIFNSMELPETYGSVDLYIGYKNPDGTWSKPINMGPDVNSSALDNLALVYPDGKYLFLRSQRNGENEIYWVSSKIIEELKSRSFE